MNLQVELSKEDLVHYFKVIGEVDAFTAPVLKEKLISVQDTPGLQAEIDLSEVDYIDSTGLGIFIGFYKVLKEKEGYVKMTGVNARLKRLFEITGIDKIIDIEMEEGGNLDATV
ncbi:STAS domain-containing protein [Sporosarcina pasteurii]|nr:STAS domain-containing protein [Sporosarcina pasteurii]MDS9472186.1 STAS domain-containing protein [Sporosarcina pasteurii]QBQ06896.1 anti-sigma factor antagonist [Sporosarcina pasteurii]